MEDITKEFPVLNYMIESLNNRIKYPTSNKIFFLRVSVVDTEVNVFVGYREIIRDSYEKPIFKGVYSKRNNTTDNKIIERWLCAHLLEFALWGDSHGEGITLQSLLNKKEN